MTDNLYDDNTTLWAASLNALVNAVNGDAIIDGCSIAKGTGDWDIDTTSGTIIATNTVTSSSAVTVTVTDPANDTDMDAGESRIDLVVNDTTDTTTVVEGTAASNPTTPDIPADHVVLGFAVIAESDSTLADSRIVDIPETADEQSARYFQGNPDAIDPADLSGASGTATQLLETDGTATSWTDRITDGTDNTSVQGSRSFSTWYQNTDGSARLVYVSVDRSFNVDINTSQSAQVVLNGGSGSGAEAMAFIVPDQHYYRVVTINDSQAILETWYESTLQ